MITAPCLSQWTPIITAYVNKGTGQVIYNQAPPGFSTYTVTFTPTITLTPTITATRTRTPTPTPTP